MCVYPLVCMYHLVWTCKFGKLGNGHRIWKCQFSFQSQRRTMLNNVQTIVPLRSFHMLERLCSKSFKTGFNSTWTKTCAFAYTIVLSLILIDAELTFIVRFLISFYIQGIWDSETPPTLHRVTQLLRTELLFRHTALWLWNTFNFYYNILIQRKKGLLWPQNILYKYKYQVAL